MSANKQPLCIPRQGEKPDHILQQISAMKAGDVAWNAGKAWSLVYYVDEAHDQLLKAASGELFSANYINPLAFKSVHRMEQEVVQMTAHLLHGDGDAVGVMPSGGTESILLAMFGYRERAKQLRPEITKPEVVAPATIHPAFDKAAVLFGLKIRKAPVDEHRRAVPAAMEALINKNTIALAASAPGYPNGVLDPVEAIAGIAVRRRLPFHVDACLGGFMLPWVEKLGYKVPPWDFRVEGVTSISADMHKFGFGAKGASVLVYRNMDYLRHQFVVTTDYPGGIYLSPTLLGTRGGGPIAAAWAGLKHLGENGYLALAKKLMDGTERLRAGLSTIPGIEIVGESCMNLLSYATKGNQPDIFVIADQLEDKGWMVDRQQFPDCIHVTVLPTNVEVIDPYLADLRAAVTYAVEHPGAAAKGNAAIYGLMARIPFRGMVDRSVKKIMEDLYGGGGTNEGDPEKTLPATPVWMGMVNRLLAAWGRWKRKFKKTPLHGMLLVCCVLFLTAQLWSQPYVDPFQVRYTYAFEKNKPAATPFTHFWAGSDLPIQLKKNSYLLISPYYEQWNLDSADKEVVHPTLHSLAIPVGLIVPFQSPKWSLTVLPIVRWSGEKVFETNTFQYGAVTFATLARKPQQKFRFGVYANKEFFGWYVMPLLGTDWRIDEKNYLFGILPGRLTYEHQWSQKWYGGATFRGLTSSHRLSNGQYIRLDDNQLSVYLDYYPAKHLCITLEPGFGLLRKIRTGIDNRDYLTEVDWGDGPFIKLSVSYRMRL